MNGAEFRTSWSYRAADGAELGLVARFEHPSGEKEIRPYFKRNGSRWVAGAGKGSRPLYGLDRLAARNDAPAVVTEGEKAADAAERLLPDHVAVTSPGGAKSAQKADWSPLVARQVTIWPDADSAGERYGRDVCRALRRVGAVVVGVVDTAALGLKDGEDAADLAALPATGLPLLHELLETAAPRASASPLNPYDATPGGFVWMKPTSQGEVPVQLTNWMARIVAENVRDDGAEEFRTFEIEYQCGGRTGRRELPAARFFPMSWPAELIGASAVIYPGFSTRDHTRTAIQLHSGSPPRKVIFAHTGWRQVDGVDLYLHAGGAIGAAGVVPGVETQPPGLDGYVLPPPQEGDELVAAIRSSLALLDLAPGFITVPILAATYRAALAPADFSLHLAGQTGAGKSELAALAQQHYGAGLDARHLPANWSSTGNQLEGQAFCAKDALLVVDDFAPGGAPFDVQRMHQKAAQLFRAQGNQQGRGRCRADASTRPGRPPRGLILSTGEDIPTRHSIRARLLVLELERGALDFDRLSGAQEAARSGHFAQALAGFIQWIAARPERRSSQLKERILELRSAAHASGEHRRTSTIVANLAAGFEFLLEYACEAGAIDGAQRDALGSRAWKALGAAAGAQAAHLDSADPVARFPELLAAALAAGRAHVASMHGLAPAPDPTGWGWRWFGKERDGVFRPQEPRIGWLDGEELYLIPEAAYAAAAAMAGGESMGVAPKTLWKRMGERRLLRSTDVGHNTTRVSVEGKRHRAVHVAASLLSPGDESIPASGPGPKGVAAPGPILGTANSPPAPESGQGMRSRAQENQARGPIGPIGPILQNSKDCGPNPNRGVVDSERHGGLHPAEVPLSLGIGPIGPIGPDPNKVAAPGPSPWTASSAPAPESGQKIGPETHAGGTQGPVGPLLPVSGRERAVEHVGPTGTVGEI